MMWRVLLFLWDVARDLGASVRLLLRITEVDHLVLSGTALGAAIILGDLGYTAGSVTLSVMAVLFSLMIWWEEFYGKPR